MKTPTDSASKRTIIDIDPKRTITLTIGNPRYCAHCSGIYPYAREGIWVSPTEWYCSERCRSRGKLL
jgi:hypothetical protein